MRGGGMAAKVRILPPAPQKSIESFRRRRNVK